MKVFTVGKLWQKIQLHPSQLQLPFWFPGPSWEWSVPSFFHLLWEALSNSSKGIFPFSNSNRNGIIKQSMFQWNLFIIIFIFQFCRPPLSHSTKGLKCLICVAIGITHRIQIWNGTSGHYISANGRSIPDLFPGKPSQHLNDLESQLIVLRSI